MTYLLLLLGVLNLVAMLVVLARLSDLMVYARATKREVAGIKTTVRTRQSVLSVSSGPVTKEQQLTKLGRASSARRVVVGGDPDSELNGSLMTHRVQEGADDE